MQRGKCLNGVLQHAVPYSTPPPDQQATLHDAKSPIKQKVVEESWAKAEVVQAERKTRNDRPEWVVTLKNASAADPQKQTLYVSLTNTGGYLTANYQQVPYILLRDNGTFIAANYARR